MNSRQDPSLAHAIAARAGGRSRLQAVTAAAGAGSLAVAGVVFFTLPGAAHKSTATSAGSSATHSGSSASARSGSSRSSSGSSGLGSSSGVSAGSGAAQATSGGS